MDLLAQCRKEVEAVAVAAIAGTLGCLMRTIKGGRPIRWGFVLVEALSSGLVGYLALRLCQALGFADKWIGVVVGVLGWAGAASSIALVERLVFRKLGVPNDVATAETTTPDQIKSS